MRVQMDKDRSGIDQNTIDIDSIKKGQEKILQQMADFKEEIRQMVKDTIQQEVPKAVKKAMANEWETMVIENPKKIVVKKMGLIESIRRKFRKK